MTDMPQMIAMYNGMGGGAAATIAAVELLKAQGEVARGAPTGDRLNALGLDRLLNLGSRQLSVGPALRLPLFDGGLLRAQLRGREAEADAAASASLFGS